LEGFQRFFLWWAPAETSWAFFPSAGVYFENWTKRRPEMKHEDELVLKIAKEVVVKFIEVGRLSVGSFDEVWNQVYGAIKRSLETTPPESSNGQ
jgi:hypothetical protein